MQWRRGPRLEGRFPGQRGPGRLRHRSTRYRRNRAARRSGKATGSIHPGAGLLQQFDSYQAHVSVGPDQAALEHRGGADRPDQRLDQRPKSEDRKPRQITWLTGFRYGYCLGVRHVLGLEYNTKER